MTYMEVWSAGISTQLYAERLSLFIRLFELTLEIFWGDKILNTS